MQNFRWLAFACLLCVGAVVTARSFSDQEYAEANPYITQYQPRYLLQANAGAYSTGYANLVHGHLSLSSAATLPSDLVYTRLCDSRSLLYLCLWPLLLPRQLSFSLSRLPSIYSNE